MKSEWKNTKIWKVNGKAMDNTQGVAQDTRASPIA